MKPKRADKPNPPADEVLMEFLLAKKIPDAALLNKFLDRYPQHAAVLKEHAVQVALDLAEEALAREAGTCWPAINQTSPAVSKTLQRVDEQLRVFGKLESRASGLERPTAFALNPFAPLTRVQMQDLGRRLHANALFVSRLRDRLIQAKTISKGFIREVAGLLQTTPQEVAAHFAAPPTMPLAASYKAEQKPQIGRQQSFAEAVAASKLTEEQQEYLLKL